LIKRGLRIDDSLDVFPVHGVGGVLGTLAAGVFASSTLGVFSGQGYANGVDMAHQLRVQAIGVLATLGYTAVMTFAVLQVVRMVTGLRVSAEAETMGLDTSEHNERGYDL
jgi:Amt family ammonium transporter